MSSITRRSPRRRLGVLVTCSITAAVLLAILFLTLAPTAPSAAEPAPRPAPTSTAADPGCVRLHGPC